MDMKNHEEILKECGKSLFFIGLLTLGWHLINLEKTLIDPMPPFTSGMFLIGYFIFCVRVVRVIHPLKNMKGIQKIPLIFHVGLTVLLLNLACYFVRTGVVVGTLSSLGLI